MVGTDTNRSRRVPTVKVGVEARSAGASDPITVGHFIYEGREAHFEMREDFGHRISIRSGNHFLVMGFDRDQIEQLHHALGDYLDLLAEDDALRALEVAQ